MRIMISRFLLLPLLVLLLLLAAGGGGLLRTAEELAAGVGKSEALARLAKAEPSLL
jgi:hypothetical protein